MPRQCLIAPQGFYNLDQFFYINTFCAFVLDNNFFFEYAYKSILMQIHQTLSIKFMMIQSQT